MSAVMVPYNNEDRAVIRLLRDLLPALRCFDAEVIVIDNSDSYSLRLADTLVEAEVDGITTCYQWQLGKNLGYGPAINRAVQVATKPYLLYVCSEHGHAYDPSWAADLLDPLINDTTHEVAMTGTIAGAGPPTNLNFPAELPDIHIQGGVFAASTDILHAYPYPDGQYAHLGADLFMCFQLMQAGFRLVDVPTVKSVWRAGAPPGAWKYTHDDGS